MEKKKIAQEFFKRLSTKNVGRIFSFLEDNRGMYTILKFIHEADKDVLAGDISKSLNISTARVAVALTSLKKRNFIEKIKSNDDARKTIVKITDIGKTALEERQNKIIKNITDLLNKLSNRDSKILLEIITKLVAPKGSLV